MIKSVLDGIGGYGEEDLKEGVDGVLCSLCVAGEVGFFCEEFCEGAPTLGNTSSFLKRIHF